MFQHNYITIIPDETGKPIETPRKMVTHQASHATDILVIWQNQRQEDNVTFRLVDTAPFTGDESQLKWNQVSRVCSLYVAHLH